MDEWNNEKSLELIDEYEKWPILWNPKHPSHFSRNLKIDAWDNIARNLRIAPIDAKQKINSLLGSLRREKAKGKKSIGTGQGRIDVYVLKWFAFKRMAFLLDKDDPGTTINTDTVELERENDSQLSDPEDSENQNDAQAQEDQSPAQSQSDQSTDQSSIEYEVRQFASPAVPKKKKKHVKAAEDARLEDAFNILKHSASAPPPDSCTIYGTHVANKLRNYSSRVRAEVEHSINNILYAADVGRFNTINSTPSTPINPPSTTDGSYYNNNNYDNIPDRSYDMPNFDYTML